MDFRMLGLKRLKWGYIPLFIMMLTTCMPIKDVIKPTSTLSPTEVQLPSTKKSEPTVVQFPIATESVDALIQIIEASDPASSSYDPQSVAYAEFPDALKMLAAMNSSDNDAASMLSYAIGFPRRDSILAAQALISLGPDWAGTTMAGLLIYLKDPRPDVRMYTAIVLSTIGSNGSCSLGNIGPLLWDSDPYVRTSAAVAIQGITGNKLGTELNFVIPDDLTTKPLVADTPEGKIVGAGRKWWNDYGSKVNWHPSYDLCDP